MTMEHDGVEIFCLPDNAKCCLDEQERSPLDMDECPIGHDECLDGCEHYTE